MKDAMYFDTIDDLRQWLVENHQTATELWVGYYKKHTSKYNFSWSESVDQFLCFGWIDGVRRSVDQDRWIIRITPRKRGSHWSKVNLEKVRQLTRSNQMYPAGKKAYKERKKASEGRASYEQGAVKLPKILEDRFRGNAQAWKQFNVFPPSVRKQSLHYVASAKRAETRLRRLQMLIACSEKGERLPHLTWGKKK
jgi:uncharacterized protein YdeI (YjbR/CyaY-like superfamily)